MNVHVRTCTFASFCISGLYDAENIAVYQIVKPDNFLHFEFIGYGSDEELNLYSEDELAVLTEASLIMLNRSLLNGALKFMKV